MQIKPTLRYHLTPVRMAIIKSLLIINARKGVEKKKPPHIHTDLFPFPLEHVHFPCDTHHHTWAHSPIHFLELPFTHTIPTAILLYLPANRTPTVFRRTVCLL